MISEVFRLLNKLDDLDSKIKSGNTDAINDLNRVHTELDKLLNMMINQNKDAYFSKYILYEAFRVVYTVSKS